MLYRWLRPLLFAMDPERAHRLAMAAMRALDWAAVRSGAVPRAFAVPALAQDLWGLHFPNPVGLAGGFDKSARAAHAWAALGFGFAELGTITAEAQAGNPRPRIFRLPGDTALINRLGFNNEGAAAVAAHLSRTWRRPGIPIGINIGKSRATPLAEATADYVRSLRLLFPFADYVAVNVSSPNTPGLRDLQAEVELRELMERLSAENAGLAQEHGTVPRPLLVKLAPDLSDDGIAMAVEVARGSGAAGVIATNTTIAREGLHQSSPEAGGLSGAPLQARATAVIRVAYRATGGALPIIGVGGIFTAVDAYEKIRAGASLVQIYTGFIYEGPGLPRRLVRGLAALVEADGYAHLRDAVGRGS